MGRYGKSKDSRPDRKQIVVGVVLDDKGHPVCCELWPGNTTDVKTLIPVTDRLRRRFQINSSRLVAERGMISQQTLQELEKREMPYILGARMRKQKEVFQEVLSRAGRYQTVVAKGPHAKSPSPLKVKEVWVKGRRYILCFNEDEAKKDAADREAILASLQDHLNQGDQLWQVEQIFRTLKSIFRTRPIFHKCDETIRGHVFCSFLMLIVMVELQKRLEEKGMQLEWHDVLQDISQLEEIELESDGKTFLLRNEVQGCCGKVFQLVGVALPPTIREKN